VRHKNKWFNEHYPQIAELSITEDPTAGIIYCNTSREVTKQFDRLESLYGNKLEVRVIEV
jgi:hypothetical protein